MLVALPLLAAHSQSRVTIERVAPKQWRATYHLTAPSRELRFDRPASFFRERVWKVTTPGYQLGRSGDRQIVTLAAGRTARSDITFEFGEFTDALPKEYELFQSFTDGGLAIYTGHFHLRSVTATGHDTVRVSSIRIVTPQGAHAIVRGKIVTGTATLTDSAGDNGTYVYIGKQKPIETPDVVAVIDPGLPPWIRTMFDQRLPALFHEYAARIGSVLPWKPVVLFGYDTAGTGLSSGGGTLTGLVNMTVTGAAWQTETSHAAEQAFHLIAHESAHLWNGQLVHNVMSGPGEWLHEGSADALANEMMRAFGVIDTARYRARKEEALNRCLSAIGATSVEAAFRRGAAVYDCGFALSLWTEAAMNTVNNRANLFTFWRALVDTAKHHGQKYSDTTYFSVLSAAGVPDSVTSRMRAFLTAQSDGGAALIDGLVAAGIPVRAGTGTPPAPYQMDAARAALVHLMGTTCGRVSIYWGPIPRTGAVATCPPFAKELLIARVSGQRVRDQGAALYDSVRSACAAGQPVTLEDDKGAPLATLTCTKELPALAPWYEIGPG